MRVTILQGHVLDRLRAMPAESVHCVVTSPPYYGLRDYKIPPQVWGGAYSPSCAFGHEWGGGLRHTGGAGLQGGTSQRAGRSNVEAQETPRDAGAFCLRCGAWRGSLGLEPTVELYLDHMVEVCREIKRVLRRDGTFWLNVGDSYCASPPGNKPGWSTSGLHGAATSQRYQETLGRSVQTVGNKLGNGCKPKDLMLIPARLALALQADGWWIRSEIVWAKRAPMPESVTDRPTSAHEKVWLLTKSARYFYDAEGVKEDGSENSHGSPRVNPGGKQQALGQCSGATTLGKWNKTDNGKRNLRNVWSECEIIPDHGEPLQDRESLPGVRATPSQIGLFAEEERCDGDTLPSVRGAGDASVASGQLGAAPCDPSGIYPLGTRQSTVAGVGRHRERQGRSKAAKCQEASAAADQGDANGGRVGGDQAGCRQPLPLLQAKDEDADDGSRDSTQQGWPARSVEHRAGVQTLQHEQAQSHQDVALTNVWKLGPSPFPGAHFATFSPEIPRRAILAGTSAKGCCPKCGAPWVRVIRNKRTRDGNPLTGSWKTDEQKIGPSGVGHWRDVSETETLGWRPSCSCDAGDPVPATCLDPFAGSGTTLLVADRLGRDCIGIELSGEYIEMAKRRLAADAGMFAAVAAE